MVADEHYLNLHVVPLYPVDAYEMEVISIYMRTPKRDIARMFWDSDPPETVRSFLNLMADGKRAMFAVMDGGALAGWFTISDVTSGIQCDAGGWIPFGYRGHDSPEIIRCFTKFVHDKLKIPCVFFKTPWRAAARLCELSDMKLVAKFGYHTGSCTSCLYIYRDGDF